MQQENKFVVKLKVNEIINVQKNDVEAWILNDQEMIKYNEALYVSENIFIHKELLKHHHHNLLIKYFDVNKISELLNCKYY